MGGLKGTIFDGIFTIKIPLIMKKSRIYLLLAVFTVIGFALGLAFEGIVGKAYANTETPKLAVPEGAAFESVASGSARSADYEIVYVYAHSTMLSRT